MIGEGRDKRGPMQVDSILAYICALILCHLFHLSVKTVFCV